MDKTAIETNIKMDSDRSFTMKAILEGDGKWLIVLKNELSNKETKLPICCGEEAAVGGFGQTLAKLSMQALWGHADTWGITVDLCSGERLLYGQTEGTQLIKDEAIKGIREKAIGDGVKDAVDNAIEVARYFIHNLSMGHISC